MIRPSTSLACLILAGLIAPRLIADEPTEWDLGGVRRAKATVSIEGEDSRVLVRFLPVKGFDPATNLRLNRGKGLAYAQQALARQLAGKRPTRFSISDGEVVESRLAADAFVLVLRVPRKALLVEKTLEVASPDEVPDGKSAKKPIASTSALFTRKSDYLDTIGQLVEHLESRADRASLILEGEPLDDYGKSLRAEAERDLAVIASEIKADLLLDFVDRDDLDREIARTHRKLLDRIEPDSRPRGEAKKEPEEVAK